MTNGVDRPVGKQAGHDFAFDLKYGQEGEDAVIANLLDIRDGNGKVEVKLKRKRDITVYVEVEQRKIGTSWYVPSGISTTEASLIPSAALMERASARRSSGSQRSNGWSVSWLDIIAQ